MLNSDCPESLRGCSDAWPLPADPGAALGTIRTQIGQTEHRANNCAVLKHLFLGLDQQWAKKCNVKTRLRKVHCLGDLKVGIPKIWILMLGIAKRDSKGSDPESSKNPALGLSPDRHVHVTDSEYRDFENRLMDPDADAP